MLPFSVNAPRRGCGEGGFTLIELLVASTLALAVAFVAMAFSGIASRNEASTSNRANALGDARVGLEQMTRELRQGASVTPAGATVDLLVPADGGLRPVRYDCSQADECRRYEGPVGGTVSGAGESVVSGVESASFTADGTDYLAVELWVTVPERDHPIALTDGVYVRNSGV